MFCHKCGIKNAEDAAFCHKCGANIAGIQTAPTGEKLLNSDIVASAGRVHVHENSEAVIQSYNTEGTVNLKIKVFCNGQHVGTVNKGECV